jgi:AcrR family transcriptional regulator
MTNRSKQAAQTRTNIIAATELLLANNSLDQVSLIAIAKEAGTTVQTVLRHMGSREGCLKAVVEVVTARVEEQRGTTENENIEAAISDLCDHYESEGKLILNFLAQERRGNSFISGLMQGGRKYHRDWVKRCFANYLPEHSDATIDALVVATDIYAWKLLRLDYGRNRNLAKEIITSIVMKILEVS